MPCKDVEWQASVQVWQHFAVKHGAIGRLFIAEQLCRSAAARDRCCMPIHGLCSIETDAECRLMLFFAQCMAGAVSCFKICIINASCLPTRSRYLKEHCCTPAAKHAEGVLYLWRHAGDYSVFFLVQGRQTPFLPTDNDHAMGVGGTVRESPLHCWTVSSHHACTACA